MAAEQAAADAKRQAVPWNPSKLAEVQSNIDALQQELEREVVEKQEAMEELVEAREEIQQLRSELRRASASAATAETVKETRREVVSLRGKVAALEEELDKAHSVEQVSKCWSKYRFSAVLKEPLLYRPFPPSNGLLSEPTAAPTAIKFKEACGKQTANTVTASIHFTGGRRKRLGPSA